MPGARMHQPRRIAGGVIVLALHLLAVAMLLRATQWHAEPATSAKEIIMRLIALPKPPQSKPEEKKKIPPQQVRAPASPYGYSFTPPETLPAAPPSGLNQQLFGCAPDQLAAATAEERAYCASASLGPRYDPTATDYHDHTDRSKNAAQWFRDRARKNAPMLLPCMSPGGFSPLYTAYCLAKTAVTGKLEGESQFGYEDMPDRQPNEGDTRMAPTPH
ncbi:MAG TPA: hypothetical protein VG867_09145 [Rhizomicrobium sp.]|nr:hypothetical protein [Rhizomicrobium sp.]